MSFYKPQIWHFLLCLGLLCTSRLMAAPPSAWQVNPADFSNSMIIVGAININKSESLDAGDQVAAFIDGECRGVASISYFAEVDRYLAYLFIYSNGVRGEEISFKLYDASADQVFDVPETEPFESNGGIGDAAKPYVFANVTLSSEALITGFSVAEQEGSTTIEGADISLKVVFGTDLSQLKPEFTLSEGATAWISETVQQSGVTPNDFTKAVVYTVRSEDEQVFTDYTVNISEAFAQPTNIQLSDSLMDENLPLNSTIAELTTMDLDDTTHVYSLVSGEGDKDNAKFRISGKKLLTKVNFDYEVASSYDFRIRSSDDEGNTIEKTFSFSLNDLNDNAPVAEDTLLKVDEDEKVNSLLYDIEATDADGVGGLFFTILSGNESGSFKLDQASGQVRLAKELDYEKTTQYLLEVELNDSVNTSLIYLDIYVNDLNDEIPRMEVDSLLEISEFWAANQLLTTIQATDADANTQLQYGIVSGNGKGWISVNADNGRITLAREVEYVPEENTDLVEVSVSDGIHTVTSLLYLEVNDINTKPVIRDSTFYIDEDAAVETLIAELVATDMDRHQTLTYSFLDGDTTNFSLSEDGLLTLAVEDVLDYETLTFYEFDVVVRDNGAPSMADTARFRILVNDVIEDVLPAVNTITPNGDGFNDYWVVDNVEIYHGFELHIFNARGNIVFESTDYQNDWDGTYRGAPLPGGVYYFIFQSQEKQYKGTITLIK
jgi:gliding motility-associated-like protein